MLFSSDSTFKTVLKLIFVDIWKIFISFQVPGTNLTVVEFVFGAMVILFVLRRGIAFAFGSGKLGADVSGNITDDHDGGSDD